MKTPHSIVAPAPAPDFKSAVAPAVPSFDLSRLLELVPQADSHEPLYQTPICDRDLFEIMNLSYKFLTSNAPLTGNDVEIFKTVSSRLMDRSPEQGFLFARRSYLSIETHRPDAIELSVHLLKEMKDLATSKLKTGFPQQQEAYLFLTEMINPDLPAARRIQHCLTQITAAAPAPASK